MVAHVCDLSTGKAKARGIRITGQFEVQSKTCPGRNKQNGKHGGFPHCCCPFSARARSTSMNMDSFLCITVLTHPVYLLQPGSQRGPGAPGQTPQLTAAGFILCLYMVFVLLFCDGVLLSSPEKQPPSYSIDFSGLEFRTSSVS